MSFKTGLEIIKSFVLVVPERIENPNGLGDKQIARGGFVSH